MPNTIALWSTMALLAGTLASGAAVDAIRTPGGGIQPRAAVDSNGTLHLVYFQGDPAAGDLFYVHSSNAGKTFSAPLRVNSQPSSAIAIGNIRGARLALGPNGGVHVAWNGTGAKASMFYARINESATAFEPQRNMITFAYGLDGGGAIAADSRGAVYVFWHAPTPGGQDEAARRVWLARSLDGGATFQPERAIDNGQTGACGCCGMEARADRNGSLYVLFRSAQQMVHRDIHLLASRDAGQTFQDSDVAPWNVGYCVMSSASFSEDGMGVMGAWETEKQVYFGRIDARGKVALQIAAPGSTDDRKHPALAVNNAGETMLAWTEGMGWKKGGSLHWQVFGTTGKPMGAAGHTDGVPVWSLIAAFARPDGGFTVVY